MLLYSTDTDAFPPEGWATLERLASEGVRLDAAIIEGTMGVHALPPDASHMNFTRCAEHHRQLRERGIAAEHWVHPATHFAPGCQPWSARAQPDEPYGAAPHEETTALLAPHGVQPAYDGLALRLDPRPR